MAKPLSGIKDGVIACIGTWPALLAVLGLVLFVITLYRPGQVLKLSNSANNASNVLWLNSAQLLTSADNLDSSKLAAQGYIDDALAEAEKEANDRSSDICYVIAAGNVLAQYGDKDKGFKLLKRSIEMAPQSFYVHLNFARKLRDGGHTEEAVDQYLMLIKNFPKQFEPRFELAGIYINDHKPKEAAEQYKILLGKNHDSSLLKKDYGLAIGAIGHEQEGFQEFVQACSVPKEQASYGTAAQSVLKNNENTPRKAIGDMRIEIATKPKQVAPRIIYAQLLLYLGEAQQAKEVANEAIKVDGRNAEAYLTLSEANLKLADHEAAFKAFEKAIDNVK